MTQTPLDELCSQLNAEFRRDPKGTGVVRLLSEYAENHSDWRAFEHFCEDTYSRNLVHRDEEFELLLLCWGAGQESLIHNHDDQSCWMAVLDGTLEEVHFREPADSGECLIQGRSLQLGRGEVAFIEDEIALHLIRPVAGKSGVSLHLYAKPIDTCRVYDPQSGVSRTVEMGYASVRGEPCLKSADEVRAEFRGAR